MDESKPIADSLASLLSAERELLREQVSAAWQLHVDSVLERLESGWREHVSAALERRFDSLAQTVAGEVEQQAEVRASERQAQAQAAARQRLAEQLSQAARRLEQAEDSAAWAAALLDGAQLFAPRVALVELSGLTARLAGCRGADPLEWSAPRPWPAIIASPADSLDTVVALASPAELSDSLHTALAPAEAARVVAVPVIAGRTEGKRRAAAVLLGIGAGSDVQAGGLELLAATAGTSLDCRLAAQRATTAAPAGVLMGIAPPPAPAPAAATSPATWRVEELQARAQRFARVKMAEIRLYRPEAVLQGRADRNLYTALREDLDRGRTEYQEQFGAIASPVDYFHEEIVRTLAHDDASLLGPEYPGSRA